MRKGSAPCSASRNARSRRALCCDVAPENVHTILGEHDLLVDCFDNAASRQLIQDFARDNKTPCLHAGLAANGEYGVVRWNADFKIDSEDTLGQPTCEGTGFLPLITMVSAALTCSLQLFLNENRFMNWNVTPTSSEAF